MRKENKRRNKIVIIAIIIIVVFLLFNSCNKNVDFSFSGDKYQTVEYGKVFNTNTIKIEKNGKTIGVEPIVDLSSVDYKKLGKYKITIKYVDKDGKVILEEKRTIEVKDTTSPDILLKGSKTITIPQNGMYIEQGYKVSDNYDKSKDIKVEIKGRVDTKVAGTYTLTYIATDTNGNTTSIIRTVIVEKEIIENIEMPNKNVMMEPLKPIGVITLQLKGTSTMYIEYPNAYTEPGYTATDTVDGNLTNKVKITGTVNKEQLGTYNVTYTVTNTTKKTINVTRKVVVRDTTPPKITINGETTTNHELGKIYEDVGASATDNHDKAITVDVNNGVNINEAGTYYVTYTATDTSGNSSQDIRTVNVLEASIPSQEIKIFGKSIQEEITAPTPDNPIPIQSLGEDGSFDIKVSGLNRIAKQGLSTPTTDSSYWWVTNQGFTPLSDGWGRYHRDNSGGMAINFINSFISGDSVELKPNTKYTLLTEIRRFDVEGSASLVVSQGYQLNDPFVEERSFSEVGVYKSILTSDSSFDGKVGLRMFLATSAESIATVEVRIMLVEGDYTKKDVTYEPYENTNYTIDLAGHEPLRSLPTGSADYIDFAKGKIVRNIGKTQLNGTEAWTVSSEDCVSNTKTMCFVVRIPEAKIRANKLLSNKYRFGHYNNDDEIMSTYMSGVITTTLFVRVDRDRLITQNLAGFKSWLANNNFEVMYELTTPIEESITLPEICKINKTCNITVLDPIGATAIVVSNINY